MTDHKKAVSVLCSQGYGPVMLPSLSAAEVSGLVAMHGADDLAERFTKWLGEYREARKATVDDSEDDNEPTELDEPTIVKAVSTDDDGS